MSQVSLSKEEEDFLVESLAFLVSQKFCGDHEKIANRILKKLKKKSR